MARACWPFLAALIGALLPLACSPKPAPVPPEEEADNTVVLTFDGELSPDGVPKPWVIQKKTGTPFVRVVAVPERNDEKVAYLRCVDSSFSLNREVKIDVGQFRHLNWSWNAERLPTSPEVNPDGAKDQALQLYLYFDGGKVLAYHWDSGRPKGSSYDDSIPLLVKIKVVVVESGQERVGTWSRVARDVYADFKGLYGGAEPPLLRAVRIQSNSQYTHSTGAGYVGPLTFREKEER